MGFKVSDTAAFQKGQQLVDDLKEKYETSDHPAVHKASLKLASLVSTLRSSEPGSCLGAGRGVQGAHVCRL